MLSSPFVYNGFQSLMGADRGRREFTELYIRPQPGQNVLDVGCGTSLILDYLPHANYWGFDISEEYIAFGRQRFGKRGQFFCKLLTPAELKNLPSFDIVLALGLLHHLDDDAAADLLALAHSALKPGGRLLTVDPTVVPKQNPIARFLVNRDRGQNVRVPEAYLQLVNRVFPHTRGAVTHRRWIPYTHWIMECTA